MSEIKETSSAYTKGAVIGGVAMAVFAIATKRGIILWTTVGIIGGGFIAYKVKEGKSKKGSTNFKNYDQEK